MSSKVIIICVNLLIILCVAATTKEINEPNDSASQIALHGKQLHLNTENLLKQLQYYSSIIKVYMANPKQIGASISKEVCTSEHNAYRNILSGSLNLPIEKLKILQTELLSNVHISQLPNLRNEYNDKINISDLTLEHTTLKGLENLIISKFNYNVCELSYEIEMYIPKLEITSTYTLNGIIDGSPILGDGEITVTVDMLKLHDHSSMNCSLIGFMDNTCKLSYNNEPVNLTTEKIMVHMANIKYQNLTESQINDKINNFIDVHSKSNKMGWTQNIVKLVKENMKKMLNGFGQALPGDLVI